MPIYKPPPKIQKRKRPCFHDLLEIYSIPLL
nr:MAG TPA: hypothetical protein [Caudoviricetes sp.]